MNSYIHNGIYFQVGDIVAKSSGYRFPGVIVAIYRTLKGEARVVVECTAEACEGIQHIYNFDQIRLVGPVGDGREWG